MRAKKLLTNRQIFQYAVRLVPSQKSTGTMTETVPSSGRGGTVAYLSILCLCAERTDDGRAFHARASKLWARVWCLVFLTHGVYRPSDGRAEICGGYY